MHLPGFINSEENLLPKDGILTYRPDLFDPVGAAKLLDALIETIQWSTQSIKMFGKIIPMPRQVAWYGDPGTNYIYSGIKNIPLRWTNDLLLIKKKVEEVSGTSFNSVLLNFYRDGNDHMSWHADDEKSLGVNPVIASVSLGEMRKFGVKHRYERDLKPLGLELASGSLVMMKGEMQEYWHHRIYPTKKTMGPRINLTFRKVIS